MYVRRNFCRLFSFFFLCAFFAIGSCVLSTRWCSNLVFPLKQHEPIAYIRMKERERERALNANIHTERKIQIQTDTRENQWKDGRKGREEKKKTTGCGIKYADSTRKFNHVHRFRLLTATWTAKWKRRRRIIATAAALAPKQYQTN